MDNTQFTATQPPLIELQPSLGIPLDRRLVVLGNNGQRAVFLGATAIHVYDAQDRAAEAAAIASLARSRVATRVELANAFGCHRNTVARLERRFAHGGMAEVVPAKRGPKGPHKVTPAVMAVVRELSHLGCVHLTRMIEQRTGVSLHFAYVSEQLKQVRAEAATDPRLWEEPEAAPLPPGAAPPAAEVRVSGQEAMPEPEEPPVVLPPQARGRYVGTALYYPALQALGLLEAARTCFRLPGAAQFGVRAVMLTLLFLSLFSKTTLEAAKHLRR